MNWYRVIGTSRQVGAIGASEPFREDVCTETAKQAYEMARTKMYEAGRELVHVTELQRDFDGQWLPVEPMAYLYQD